MGFQALHNGFPIGYNFSQEERYWTIRLNRAEGRTRGHVMAHQANQRGCRQSGIHGNPTHGSLSIPLVNIGLHPRTRESPPPTPASYPWSCAPRVAGCVRGDLHQTRLQICYKYATSDSENAFTRLFSTLANLTLMIPSLVIVIGGDVTQPNISMGVAASSRKYVAV
jgi:hypothetical protein